MTITYTWQVDQMERQSTDGLVTTVHWRANAQDGNFFATIYNVATLERGDEFIPFNDLTQEQVISWVKDKVDAEATEAALASQIEAQKTPVTLFGRPWDAANPAE